LSVYDVYDDVPTWVYVPEALVLRNTLYPVAPVAEDQLTVMAFDDDDVADTLAGAAGFVVAPPDE